MTKDRRPHGVPAPIQMKFMVSRGYGFYLKPHAGPAGAEAIAYLPMYNNSVRNRYIRKGFKQLNVAHGEFNGGGDETLVLKPPTDETIEEVVEELRNRLEQEADDIQTEMGYYTEMAEDSMLDGDFKRLLREKIRALKARFEHIDKSVPTTAMLKSLFYREHRMTLAMDVDPQVRSAVERLVEERQWASVSDELQLEVAKEITNQQRDAAKTEA